MQRTRPLWSREDVAKLGFGRKILMATKKIVKKTKEGSTTLARKTATEVAKKADEYAEQKRKEREAYQRAYRSERIKEIKKKARTEARASSEGVGSMSGFGLKSFDEMMYGSNPKQKKRKRR